jgi:two-component system, response regulator PdtaR
MNSLPETPIIPVVEDEGVVRQMSADELVEAGYQVLEAANAQEAIALLEADAGVAVLFTDINMPGDRDGLELAQLVHERWPRVRLLVTSGGPSAHDPVLPDDGRFIAKPYSLRRLCSLVAELVDSSAERA